MSDGGKGSSPRPFSVDRKTFEQNWDRIFSRDTPGPEESDQPAPLKNDYYDLDDGNNAAGC